VAERNGTHEIGRMARRFAHDKLVSEPVDLLWLNETARMKSDAWRGGLRMRLNATGGHMIADTTPMGENWVFTDLYLPSLSDGDPHFDPNIQHPDYSSHIWHTADNPAVSDNEIAAAQATLPAAYFNREYLADFSAFHGQIFETFNPVQHVPSSVPEYSEKVIGVDWGYADDHPGAVIAVGIDKASRSAVALDSTIKAKKTDDWWQGRIADMVRAHQASRVWCDPSRPALLEALRRSLRKSEVYVNVKEADNAVFDGIMFLAGMFGRNQLLIRKGQDTLVRQLKNYHWEVRSGTQETKERPAKIDDDGCDALRYAIASELRIKRLTHSRGTGHVNPASSRNS
jgi:hypothetical protein